MHLKKCRPENGGYFVSASLFLLIPPRTNGSDHADDNFKGILVGGNIWIFNEFLFNIIYCVLFLCLRL